MSHSGLTLLQIGILFLFALFSSELLLQLPFRNYLTLLNTLLRRIVKTLRSAYISDHWKERVIQIYALRLFGYSLILPALFLVAMLPLMFGLWLVTNSVDSLIALGLDPLMLVGITLTSAAYFFLRTRRYG